MKIYSFLLAILLLLTPEIFISQNTLPEKGNNTTPKWVEMVKDVNVNFYDIQNEVGKYFETHYKGKGSGWKQYKRWEYFTEQRVFPSGNRIDHSQIWNEVNKFRDENNYNRSVTSDNWTCLGPDNSTTITGHWNPGLGRINVIALDPNDYMTIYAGTPSGGLWKTTDEGVTWNCLTDDLPVIGVSAVAINPNNTDIVYAGTGDKDASDNYSIGVLKSMDGGETWNTTGLTWTVYENNTIAKLIINPDNPDILFAATTNGVYKTVDGGNNWYLVLNGDIDDIEFKPGNPNTIYAVTQRFFKSVDGGESFSQTTGIPTSSRAQIAVSDANPDYVYFFSSGSGIYRSEDSGESFSMRSYQPNQGSQAWYDLAFCVSHTNAEEVHLGEINTWKSLNGGTSWTKTTDWTWDNPIGYTHCDIHEMVFYGSTLYVGSDGLISKSTDGAATFTDLTQGMVIRQFYRIGTSKNDPYKIMGGSQDNGTSIFTNDHWHEWLGADGMECVVDHSNSNIVYGTSQNGVFYKSISGGNNGGVDISQPGDGNWITPFVMHPQDPETLYVGSSEVMKTTNGMMSWNSISNLGLGNLNCVSISESDPNYLYVSMEDIIYRTKNEGASWENISNGLPNLTITYIAVHPEDPETIAVSYSGYAEGEKVYISYDGGDNWENYSRNLPNLPANCVAFFVGRINPLYVGMDIGVYYIDNLNEDWSEYMMGLPNVIVNELEINIDAKLIRAATYGRGLWESPVHVYAPMVDFDTYQTTIPVGCATSFYNLTEGPADSYYWTFEGGNPSSSTDRDPVGIIYDNEGVYNVQLIATNEMGSDTLLREGYITVSSSLLPGSDFIANDTIVCSNKGVEFIDLTSNCPESWSWSFDPANVVFIEDTDANSQNPIVVFGMGNYDVSLTTTNSVGSQTVVKESYIKSGGINLPFIETFEFSNIIESGWTIENPDESITWAMATVGGNSPGNTAAWMDFINYSRFRQRDRLISPALSFDGFSKLDLMFEHAYAQRGSLVDSLIVLISSDCGDTWERIFAGGPDGEGVFETAEPTIELFVPETNEDWCGNGYGSSCNIINLDEWAGMQNIKIMFETSCGYGNSLFIDNIEISNNVRIGNNDNEINISIMPNPNTGVFKILCNDPYKKASINVRDLNGKNVYQKEISNSSDGFSEMVDISAMAKGFYFVEIQTENSLYVKKVILN